MIPAGLRRSLRSHHGTACRGPLTNWPARRRPRHSSKLRFGEAQLKIGVGSSPNQRQTRSPVLAIDGLTGVGMLFWRQNANRSRKRRAGDPASNGAWRHLDLRIVANALGLAQVAAGHDIEFVAVLAEPYRSRDGSAVLAEGGERYIFLAVDGRGNCSGHGAIVTAG